MPPNGDPGKIWQAWDVFGWLCVLIPTVDSLHGPHEPNAATKPRNIEATSHVSGVVTVPFWASTIVELHYDLHG